MQVSVVRTLLERKVRIGATLVALALAAGFAILKINKSPSIESVETDGAIVINDHGVVGVSGLYLGRFENSSPKAFRVSVHNQSERVLLPRVERISCGCLTARFTAETLSPGAVVFLEGEIDGRGRDHGFVTQTADLRFNGLPNDGLHSLSVSAAIPGFWAAPSSLSISADQVRRGEYLTFSVFSMGGGELSQPVITSDPPVVHVEAAGSARSLTRNTVDANVDERLEQQLFRLRVEKRTSGMTTRVRLQIEYPGSIGNPLIVPILVEPITVIRSNPPRGLLTRLPAGKDALFEFKLSTSDEHDIDWQDVVVSADCEVNDVGLSALGKHEAKLRVSAPMKTRILRGEILGTLKGVDAFKIPLIAIADEDHLEGDPSPTPKE